MKFDFLKYCKLCQASCCKVPYKAYVSKIERNEIIEYLNQHELNFKDENIFEIHKFPEFVDEIFYTIHKKKDGNCIFLSEDEKCVINEVKPLDCKIFPFSFDYFLDTNNFVFYIGNCNAVKEMEYTGLLKEYIKESQKIMKKFIRKFKNTELSAFSRIMSVPELKEISEID